MKGTSNREITIKTHNHICHVHNTKCTRYLIVHDTNCITILLAISSMGMSLTLAGLFENAGLSMDLFASPESGERDTFLVDLFITLVIGHSLIYLRQLTQNVIIKKKNFVYAGTKYVCGRIDQTTKRPVGTSFSSSMAAASLPAGYIPERSVLDRSSRASDRPSIVSTASSHPGSSCVRRNHQQERLQR